jgi:hypothetical protein
VQSSESRAVDGTSVIATRMSNLRQTGLRPALCRRAGFRIGLTPVAQQASPAVFL